MTNLPDEVREGEVLAGKYRIEGRLGAGGMGELVAARHLLLGEKVAIKFMSGDSWEQKEAVARFVQEARAAIRIHSEHVVRVLDVAVLESGVPYIVMEHLAGSDLAALLAAKGPLPVPNAVDHLLEACEAVAEAHRLGIVHRDLKPANLFLSQREGAAPMVKVLDFGISKNTRLAAETANVAGSTQVSASTLPKTLLGSPFHMSPEQMESARDVDHRTDIWALGVTLFELVTGKPPYGGTTLIQVYSKMMASGTPPWKRSLRGAAASLEDVLAKCLARRREDRYADIDALAKALAPFGSARAMESAQRIARIQAGAELDDATAAPLESTRRPLQRRTRQRPVVAFLVVPAIVACVLGAALATRVPTKSVRATEPIASAASRDEPGPSMPSPTVTPSETAVTAPLPLADRRTAADAPAPTPRDPGSTPVRAPEQPRAKAVSSTATERPTSASTGTSSPSSVPSRDTIADRPVDSSASPSPAFDIKQMLERRK
jgi:hypothetical protein